MLCLTQLNYIQLFVKTNFSALPADPSFTVLKYHQDQYFNNLTICWPISYYFQQITHINYNVVCWPIHLKCLLKPEHQQQ